MALQHDSRLAGNHDSGVGMDDCCSLGGPATALATITARNAAQGDPGENSDDQPAATRETNDAETSTARMKRARAMILGDGGASENARKVPCSQAALGVED